MVMVLIALGGGGGDGSDADGGGGGDRGVTLVMATVVTVVSVDLINQKKMSPPL